MNISPISVLLIIMCLCTASCLVEKQEQETKKGKQCRSPKGTDGSVRNEGCIKSTCSNGKWKPTLRSDICCYNQKVHKPNTEIAKVVGEDNCTTIIGCEKDGQLYFKHEQCDMPSTKQQVDELEKNIEDQIGEVVTKIENVNITNGEKVNQVEMKIEKIEKQVDGLREKVDGLEKNIEDQFEEVVIKIENVIITIGEKGDELSSQVDQVEKKIEKQVDDLSSKVTDNADLLLQIIAMMKQHPEGDPQCDGSYANLTDAWRRIEYGVKHPTYHCDNGLAAGWYRFSFPSAPYAKIPTKAPLEQYLGGGDYQQSCGTHAVSWMEDSMPDIGQPPKDVTISFAWTDTHYPKFRSTPAKIVACPAGVETMYLYYLPPTPGCVLAYCAL